MLRAGRAIVAILLVASVAAGARQMWTSWRLLPDFVERSLSRPAGEEQRWLTGISRAVAFAAALTPATAETEIELVTCGVEVRHLLGAPFTLFPRHVRVVAAPTGRATAVLQACGGAAFPPFEAPRGATTATLSPGRYELQLSLPARGSLIGLLFPRTVQGRLTLEGFPRDARIRRGRALLPRPVALGGPAPRAWLVLDHPAAAALDPQRRPLATAISLPTSPGTYRRSADGTLLLHAPHPIAPPAAGDRELPRGSLLRGAAALPLIALLGLVVVRALPIAGGPALRLALAWGAGCGAFAVADFVLGVAGLSPAPRAAAMGGAALLLATRRARWRPAEEPPAPAVVRVGFGVVAGLATILALISGLLYPRDRTDSYAFWGVKAKALYLDGTLTPGFLARDFYHQDYPPLGPLVEAALFRAAGGVDDRLAALPSPLSLLAIGLALAGGGGLLGPLAGAALLLNPRMSHEAAGSLMDVHVALFGLLGILVLERADGSAAVTAFGAALLGLAAFAKNDGMTFVAAALVVGAARFAAGRLRAAELAALAAGLALVLLPWIAFRTYHGLSTDIVNARMAARTDLRTVATQLPPVLAGLARQAASVSGGQRPPGFDGAFLAVAAGIAAALASRRCPPAMATFLAAVAVLCLVYGLLPPRRLELYFQTTGQRVPMQLLPAGIYAALRGIGRR